MVQSNKKTWTLWSADEIKLLKELYPKHRPFEKFKEWFDVELCSEVLDFIDEEIEKEEV